MLRISIPFPVGYTHQNNYLKGKHFEQQCFRLSAGSHIFLGPVNRVILKSNQCSDRRNLRT